MRRRTLVPVLVLILALAALVVLPRTGLVRGWVLTRVQGALEGAGIDLTWQDAGGDLWRGVTLHGAELAMQGADVTVHDLGVEWFLPSLITGELPLSVTLDGVRGNVDVNDLGLSGGGAGGGGGGLPIRPRLRSLTLNDARLEVQNVPYTLPSASLHDVTIEPNGDQLDLGATLTTPDGSATVEGTLDVQAGSFDGTVVRADARLARNWWEGADAGVVSGALHVGKGGIRGDFALRGGALHALDLQPHDIHGNVRLRFPLLTADVRGTVLGGAVHASGTVNVAARRWDAQGSGGAQLLEAADWLARGRLGSDFPLSGSATVTLTAHGWSDVHVSGSAHGAGTLAGLPVDDLAGSFTVDSGSGVAARATAEVAGGPVIATVDTTPAGIGVHVDGSDLAPVAGASADARLDLVMGAQSSGTMRFDARAAFAARTVSATLDAGLDADGWQGFVSASDERGETAQGALVFAGGSLTGQLAAKGVTLPGVRGEHSIGVRVDGPPTRLPFTVLLGERPGAVHPASGPVGVDADLTGSVSGVLAGTRLERLDGALGPLHLGGSATLAPVTAELDLRLDRVALTGPVSANLSVPSAHLSVAAGGVSATGTVDLGTVRAGPLAADLGRLQARFGTSGGPRLHVEGARGAMTLDLTRAEVQAHVSDLPITLAGEGGTLAGTLVVPTGAPDAMLAGLEPDLTLTAPNAELRVRRVGGRIGADVSAQPGLALGPLTLAQRATLTATLDADSGGAAVVGRVGEANVRGALVWDGGTPRARGQVGTGDGTLSVVVGGAERWSIDGTADIATLAAIGGWPGAGTLQADHLAAGPDGYAGSATLTARSPVSGSLELHGEGARLTATATVGLGPFEGTARGSLLPALDLEADVGPLGPVRVDATGSLAGSGTLEARTLAPGLELPALDWRIGGGLAQRAVTLELGDGSARLDLAQGARLAAKLSLPLDYGGTPLRLAAATVGAGADAAGVGAPYESLSAGPASLALRGSLTGDGVDLAFSGTPQDLTLDGSADATAVTAPWPALPAPAGTLALRAHADLTGGPSYAAQATWSVPAGDVELSAHGTGRDLEAALDGLGLHARVAQAGITLRAKRATPAALLADPPVRPVLDGELTHQGGAWRGTMTVSTDAPVDASVTLQGDGGGLSARLHASVAGVTADGAGALLPEPDLGGRLTGASGLVGGDWSLSGAWSAPLVQAAVHTARWSLGQAAAVPATDLRARWRPASGELEVEGPLTLSGTVAEVHGSLDLPLELLGDAHRLSAEVDGPLTAPTVQGRLAGPLAHGAVALAPGAQDASAAAGRDGGAQGADVALDLTLDRSALAAAPDAAAARAAAFLGGDVTVRAGASFAGSWHADLATVGGLGPVRVPLRARLDGEGAQYQGRLVLGGDQPLLPLELSGTGSDLHARADLGALDLPRLGELLGAQLTGTAGGSLTLDSRPFEAALTLDATGAAAGTPFEVAAKAALDGGRRLTLDAKAAGMDVHAEGDPLARLDVSVHGGAPAFELAGALAVTPSPTVDLSGTALGKPASLHAGYDPATREGAVRASLGDARLTAAATPRGDALAVHLAADAPAGAVAPVGATVDAAAVWGSGSLTLERLDASLHGAPTPVRLELAGDVWPRTDAAGALELPSWGRTLDLSIRGRPAAETVDATFGGLSLSATTDGAALASVGLDGAAALDVAAGAIDVRADALRWTAGQGFSGAAHVDAPAAATGLPLAARAELNGAGTLAVQAGVGPAAAPWARLAATIAADPLTDRGVSGNVALSVPLADLASLPAGTRLSLSGTPQLGGTWSDPRIDGPVAVNGALAADGTVHLTRAGGTLELAGDTVHASARLGGGAWSATVALTQADIAPLVPRIDSAHVSLKAEASGGGGHAFEASVDGLELTAPGTRVTGSGTLGGGVRMAVNVQSDLAALNLPGPGVRGLVRGPLVLTAPSLARIAEGNVTAVLDVARLGADGIDGSVTGTLQLGGNPAAPLVSAALQGDGGVHGNLRLDAEPAKRRVSLRSDLSYGPLHTDLRLSFADGRAEANGSARYGDAAVVLAAGTQGEVTIDGAGRLEGWRASVQPDLSRAQIHGPLAAVPGVGGTLDLALGGAPWLRGTVSSAAVAGRSVPDLHLTSASAGAPIEVRADGLQGSVDPVARSWSARLDAFGLAAGATASGTAHGTLTRAEAELNLGGSLLGAPLDVAASVTLGGGARVAANGSALGGSLALDAGRTPAGAWDGRLALAGAAVGGESVDLRGTVQGSGSVPNVVLDAGLKGPVTADGRVIAGSDGISVDLSASVDALREDLHLAGRLLPSADVTLEATAAGAAAATRGATLHLFEGGGGLRATGALQAHVGPATLAVQGRGAQAPPTLALSVALAPGLAFAGPLPDAPLTGLPAALADGGLVLRGTGATSGAVVLRSGAPPSLTFRNVAYAAGRATLHLQGPLTLVGGAPHGDLEGSLELPGGLPVAGGGAGTLPFQLSLARGGVDLRFERLVRRPHGAPRSRRRQRQREGGPHAARQGRRQRVRRPRLRSGRGPERHRAHRRRAHRARRPPRLHPRRRPACGGRRALRRGRSRGHRRRPAAHGLVGARRPVAGTFRAVRGDRGQPRGAHQHARREHAADDRPPGSEAPRRRQRRGATPGRPRAGPARRPGPGRGRHGAPGRPAALRHDAARERAPHAGRQPGDGRGDAPGRAGPHALRAVPGPGAGGGDRRQHRRAGRSHGRPALRLAVRCAGERVPAPRHRGGAAGELRCGHDRQRGVGVRRSRVHRRRCRVRGARQLAGERHRRCRHAGLPPIRRPRRLRAAAEPRSHPRPLRRRRRGELRARRQRDAARPPRHPHQRRSGRGLRRRALPRDQRRRPSRRQRSQPRRPDPRRVARRRRARREGERDRPALAPGVERHGRDLRRQPQRAGRGRADRRPGIDLAEAGRGAHAGRDGEPGQPRARAGGARAARPPADGRQPRPAGSGAADRQQHGRPRRAAARLEAGGVARRSGDGPRDPDGPRCPCRGEGRCRRCRHGRRPGRHRKRRGARQRRLRRRGSAGRSRRRRAIWAGQRRQRGRCGPRWRGNGRCGHGRCGHGA